jgi:hypothetical protein
MRVGRRWCRQDNGVGVDGRRSADGWDYGRLFGRREWTEERSDRGVLAADRECVVTTSFADFIYLSRWVIMSWAAEMRSRVMKRSFDLQDLSLMLDNLLS